MRTAFLINYPPYPPIGGAPLRNWQNISALRDLGPVCVIGLTVGSESMACLPDGIEGHGVPVAKQRWRRLARRLGVAGRPDIGAQFYSTAADREVGRLLASFRPDLTIIEGGWLARYGSCARARSSRLIYDAHNVEAVLRADIASSSAKANRAGVAGTDDSILRHEGRLIAQSDQVWVCSQDDSTLMREIFGDGPDVVVVPNTVDVDAPRRSGHGSDVPAAGTNDGQRIVLFNAAFGYRPNNLAAQWLIDEIFPRIRASCADAVLHLVGKEPTRQMLDRAAAEPYVEVLGLVPDMWPHLMASSVVIVPLLHGGGTRLKILEAFAAKRPVVSTPKGAEGIAAHDGEHLLVAENADGLAACVARLLSDPGLVARLTAAAYDLVCRKYSWGAARDRIHAAVLGLDGARRSGLASVA